MTTDPYSPCPCGSGKKFKWCCQPIYAGIHRAFEQDASGQHDAALRTMDQVVADHPGNPEVHGQKARLLSLRGQHEQAEEALQKAFDLNPNYPFGLLLRATFRYQEGELTGALLLARRAAEAYDPEAKSFLAQAYWLIFEGEMRRQRPVAGRAALRLVRLFDPGDDEVQNTFDQIFGEGSRLPACARREYAFKSPAPGGPRRQAWDGALRGAGTPRLGDAARAFEALVQEDDGDSAAWFNLGLSRAWLGDNAPALEALERYLELEPDEPAAAEAAALAEVLRCAAGLEDECDYHEYSFFHEVRDPQPVNALLNDWMRAQRLIPLEANQEQGALAAIVLEMTSPTLVTMAGPTAEAGRLAGYLVISGNIFQVTGPLHEPFGRLREETRQRLGLGVGHLQERRGPVAFHDVVAEALIFPATRKGDEEAGTERVLEHARRYYEETWVHRPRRSLGGVAPVDAVGHAKLRKKVRGVIQFIQDCSRSGMLGALDFDRLRRKLGLLGAAPAAGAGPADVTALGAGELAALPVESLSDEQLEQAYQTAHRLDAYELTAYFAKALVGRPPRPGRPDRYPWYAFLTQKALDDGDADAALDYVNEGERVDCEHNDGRRRDDYELRRGQVHVKRGEADAAHDVFGRLVERAPANLRYRGQAAEAMLALKQGARALAFAEAGLAAARQNKDRDSEHYLAELATAAKRQMG